MPPGNPPPMDPKAKAEYLKLAQKLESVVGTLDKVKTTVENLDKNVESIEKAYE
jgi:hypothetical protein